MHNGEEILLPSPAANELGEILQKYLRVVRRIREAVTHVGNYALYNLGKSVLAELHRP